MPSLHTIDVEVHRLEEGKLIDGTVSSGPGRAFLIPGIYGDEPQIGEFRRRVSERVSLDLVDMPSLGASGAVLSSMAATAGGVAEEIRRRQPAGTLSIVGYSFGASVALEVAALLERQGRSIGFLGILDGPFDADALPGGHAAMPRPTTVKAMIRTAVIDRAGANTVAREVMLAAASPKLVGTVRHDMLQRAVLKNLRSKALLGWHPPSCRAPGLHVHTGVYSPTNAALWHRLCPNLRQVEIAGSHDDLLTGEALDAIAHLFEESFAC